MKTFNFMQALIPYNLKGPRFKALEPDCLFPSIFNYDTVSQGGGKYFRDLDAPQLAAGEFTYLTSKEGGGGVTRIFSPSLYWIWLRFLKRMGEPTSRPPTRCSPVY
jgi:hypothetical protein